MKYFYIIQFLATVGLVLFIFFLGFFIGKYVSKQPIIIDCVYYYDDKIEFPDKNVTFKLEE